MDREHQLGSGPIQEEYATAMRCIALILDEIFNEGVTGPRRKVGFVLMVFPFGEAKDGRCNYISNGANREDIVKLLREQANRFDTKPQ